MKPLNRVHQKLSIANNGHQPKNAYTIPVNWRQGEGHLLSSCLAIYDRDAQTVVQEIPLNEGVLAALFATKGTDNTGKWIADSLVAKFHQPDPQYLVSVVKDLESAKDQMLAFIDMLTQQKTEDPELDELSKRAFFGLRKLATSLAVTLDEACASAGIAIPE